MSTPPPLPMASLEPHVRQMVALAELLLGAAQADGKVSWSERSAIAGVLASYLGTEIPEAVMEHMRAFDLAHFDVEAACAALTFEGPDDRRALLDLLDQVTGADTVLRVGERAYLTRVGYAIGANDEELAPYLTDYRAESSQ